MSRVWLLGWCVLASAESNIEASVILFGDQCGEFEDILVIYCPTGGSHGSLGSHRSHGSQPSLSALVLFLSLLQAPSDLDCGVVGLQNGTLGCHQEAGLVSSPAP